MNWYEYVEQKRSLLIVGTIIICLTLIAVTTRWFNVAYDSFWHLQMGLDWLENGQSLWRDHFSFTFNGEEIINPPYLFEVTIAWLVTQFGIVSGFEVFKFGSFLLAFGLVTLFLRQLRSPATVYCLVLPLLAALLQLRAVVRPELIGFSFSVLAVMLYYRARGRMSAASMFPILALMLVWSNYHAPIFGYIIFFGYFVDIALQQMRDRVSIGIWLQWLGWGLAAVAVGFLHPGFNHPLIQLLLFSPEWKNLIQEYQSSNLYIGLAGIYSLIGLTLITLVLALRNRKFGLLLVCLILTFFSVSMARMVTPSAFVILCIFAWMVSETDLEKQFLQLPRVWVNAIGGILMIFFVLSMTSAVNTARNYMKHNRFSVTPFPEDVAGYMIDQGISGRIFNEYGAGGYLIYRLSPASQIYIDGRTGILYPIEHFLRYQDALQSSDVLRGEIEKYDIDLAILPNYLHTYALVRDTGLLGLDYVGAKFSLFRRDNPNFPVLGTLLAYPACWNTDMLAALEEEQNRVIGLLPRDSVLLPYAQLVFDYTKSDDRALFLTDLVKSEQMPRDSLAFAGYQALSHGLDSMAYELFTTSSEREFSDYLGAALAKARMGEWKASEQLLDEGTRVLVSTNINEIAILHGLLAQIRQNIVLERFDDAYIDRLAKDVGASNDPTPFLLPDIQLFCPEIKLGNG